MSAPPSGSLSSDARAGPEKVGARRQLGGEVVRLLEVGEVGAQICMAERELREARAGERAGREWVRPSRDARRRATMRARSTSSALEMMMNTILASRTRRAILRRKRWWKASAHRRPE